jgi:hypothetical protein
MIRKWVGSGTPLLLILILNVWSQMGTDVTQIVSPEINSKIKWRNIGLESKPWKPPLKMRQSDPKKKRVRTTFFR